MVTNAGARRRPLRERARAPRGVEGGEGGEEREEECEPRGWWRVRDGGRRRRADDDEDDDDGMDEGGFVALSPLNHGHLVSLRVRET